MNDSLKNDCEELKAIIPCELADRVRKFRDETDTDLNTIMIEALDAFLRGSKL